ncbi:MAG: hypothetical protein V4619_01865 [Bacteroidota bacterium]
MFSNQERAERLEKYMQYDAYKDQLKTVDPKGDTQLSKYYVISENKHVLVASTQPSGTDIPSDVKTLFASSAVFLTIVTAALAKEGFKLEDREQVTKIFAKSQQTAHVGSYVTKFDYTSSEFSISTALLKVLVKGLSPGVGALDMAEDILAIMGDNIKVAITNSQTTKKIAHVMFMAEYLMGLPLVTISVFWVIASDASFVTSSNCHSTSSQTIHSTISRDDYIFVDPKWIAEYGPGMVNSPDFNKIVDEFAKLLK